MASHTNHGRMAIRMETSGGIKSLRARMGIIGRWSRSEPSTTTVRQNRPVGRHCQHGMSESRPSQKQGIAGPGRVRPRSTSTRQTAITHRLTGSENGVLLSTSRLCLLQRPWRCTPGVYSRGRHTYMIPTRETQVAKPLLRHTIRILNLSAT